MVPEGAGGFYIAPAAGSGPVSCRCSLNSLVSGQDQRGNNGPTHRNCSLVRERQEQSLNETPARTITRVQQPTIEILENSELDSAAGSGSGLCHAHPVIFYVPYTVPHLLRRTAIVPPALCGAAGFLMLRETRRARQDN